MVLLRLENVERRKCLNSTFFFESREGVLCFAGNDFQPDRSAQVADLEILAAARLAAAAKKTIYSMYSWMSS